MASAFSHALVALAIGKAIPHNELTWRVLFLGMFCSIVPDFDVIGFRFGIHYGDVWGHRGLTHSCFFAALLSGTLVSVWYRQKDAKVKTMLCLYFFVTTASHGVLDAMTNGGLGVAFLSPFDTTRYFFGLRPVAVSPIGISEFFTAYGVQVLASEALWIWLPSAALFLAFRLIQRMRSDQPIRELSPHE